MLRTATVKYIQTYNANGAVVIFREYYDLTVDPIENVNLLADGTTANDPPAATVNALAARLAAWPRAREHLHQLTGVSSRSSSPAKDDGRAVALADAVRSHHRAKGAGAYQFQRPSSRIVAGTSKARTSVASTSTATARPTPIIAMNTMPEVAKAPTTTTKSSAALVMMPPVRCSPRATARVLSWLASHSSRIRESRNTS